MKINIHPLNKTDILLALYNGAHYGGSSSKLNSSKSILLALMKPTLGKRSKALSEIIIAMRTNEFYFDYIDLGAGLRAIKCNLSGPDFDATQYDEYNGQGLAKKIIEQLRNGIYPESQVETDEESEWSGDETIVTPPLAENTPHEEQIEDTENLAAASAPLFARFRLSKVSSKVNIAEPKQCCDEQIEPTTW